MDTTHDEINIWELLVICAKRKKLIVIITFLFILYGVISSLLAPVIFEATTTIAPKQDGKSSQLGNLSSLAGMMGVNIGSLAGGADLRMVEYTLKNGSFLLDFSDKSTLLSDAGITSNMSVEDKLTAIKRIVRVSKDEKQGTISLALQSRSPKKAYEHINELLLKLNTTIVQTQQKESQKLIDELQKEMARTADPLLKAELSKLWADEAKRTIYSRINENTLYRIVNEPIMPEKRIKPRRAQTVIVFTMLGFILGIIVAFFIEYLESVKRDTVSGEYYRLFVSYMGFDKLPFIRRR